MWQFAVFASIILGNVFATALFHELGSADSKQRAQNVALQYAFIFTATAVLWFFFGTSISFAAGGSIAIVGAINALGAYFQWRAYAISLNVSALILTLTTVFAFSLSGLLLGEWEAFSEPFRLLGICLVVFGITLYFIHGNKKNSGYIPHVPLSFLNYALPAVLIFGTATFFINVWAQNGITPVNFVFSWYTGAFIGSLVLLIASAKNVAFRPRAFSARQGLLILGAAVCVLGSMGFSFVSFQLVGQALTLPIYAVGGIVGPALVGIVFFREWEQMDRVIWAYFGIAFLGALLLALA